MDRQVNPMCSRGIKQRLKLCRSIVLRVREDGETPNTGNEFEQDLLPLAVEVGREDTDAAGVTAGTRERTPSLRRPCHRLLRRWEWSMSPLARPGLQHPRRTRSPRERRSQAPPQWQQTDH